MHNKWSPEHEMQFFEMMYDLHMRLHALVGLKEGSEIYGRFDADIWGIMSSFESDMAGALSENRQNKAQGDEIRVEDVAQDEREMKNRFI